MIKIQRGWEEINSRGGNILTGAMLQLKSWDKINTMRTKRIKHGEISHSDILKIAAALLAQGHSDFADIDLFREDSLFKEALKLRKIPSAETLRQRLNDLGLCNSGQTLIDDCVVEILRKVNDFGKIREVYTSKSGFSGFLCAGCCEISHEKANATVSIGELLENRKKWVRNLPKKQTVERSW